MNVEIKRKLNAIYKSNGKVLVVGLGITGFDTALVLATLGLKVVGIDRLSKDKFLAGNGAPAKVAKLEESGVELHFGVDGREIEQKLAGIELAILSPGVKLEGPICGTLSECSVPFIGELELAVALLAKNTIIITGSNGKSTTTSLIHALLEAGGFQATLCGNIGVPVIREVRAAHLDSPSDGLSGASDWLVIEASSYQLEGCTTLKPNIGVFLNLSENHLERHGNMERYFAAKRHAFELQDACDFLIANSDDQYGKRLLQGAQSLVAPFGRELRALQQCELSGWSCELVRDNRTGALMRAVLRSPTSEESYNIAGSKLIGSHTRYNIAAALLAARRVGVAPQVCEQVINSFTPLAHRFEKLDIKTDLLPNRVVINDSKSTTVAATQAAVSAAFDSFPQSKLIVMIGGLAKAGSWDPLMHSIPKDLTTRIHFICFGQDARLLAGYCQAHGFTHELFESLQAATESALGKLAPNEVLLLSPGCASFDQFTDFEQRGDMFKSWVAECLRVEILGAREVLGTVESRGEISNS